MPILSGAWLSIVVSEHGRWRVGYLHEGPEDGRGLVREVELVAFRPAPLTPCHTQAVRRCGRQRAGSRLFGEFDEVVLRLDLFYCTPCALGMLSVSTAVSQHS